MLNDIQVNRVYLACGSTDMRKSIDCLAVLVKEGFDLDPFHQPCSSSATESGTPRGATASATIYSVIETAKEHDLNPFAYLTWLFEQLPQLANLTDAEALDGLMPWSTSLPPACRLDQS